MDIYNATFNELGTIDAEINHPVHGRIPVTLSPDDPATADAYSTALANGPTEYVEPTVDPAELLAQERAAMSCSRMQGILMLGEEKWGEVLAYRETATWAEKVIIDASGQWERLSENIEFIGYLVGYDDEQMDDLFRAAMQVKA